MGPGDRVSPTALMASTPTSRRRPRPTGSPAAHGDGSGTFHGPRLAPSYGRPAAAAVVARPPTLVAATPLPRSDVPSAAGAGRMDAMIKVEGLTRNYGDFIAVDDISFVCQPGTGHRLPRPQRCRQDHHDAGHGRAHPADQRPRSRSAATSTTTSPTPAATSASCSTPRPSTPAAPAARSSTIGAKTMGLPTSRVDEMLDAGLARRRPRPSAGCATTPSA